MINTLRHKNIINISTNNIFIDSFETISDRCSKNKVDSNSIPTFFFRRIGTENNENNILNNYINKLKQKSITYKFINNKLVFNNRYIFLSDLKSDFKTLKNDFSNIKTIIFKAVSNYFKKTKFTNEITKGNLVESINKTITLFIKTDKTINSSKILNFFVKLLYWLDELFYELIGSTNKYLNNSINSKIIYAGEISKHESYLLYCLFNIGVDVIYLNSKSDNLLENIPLLSNCSSRIKLNVNSTLFKYSIKNLNKVKQSKINVTRPTVNTTRPTVNTTRPTVNTTRPTVNVTRPTVNVTRPTVNVTRPTVNTTRPTVNVTRTASSKANIISNKVKNNSISTNRIADIKEYNSKIVIKKREFKNDLKEILSMVNERIGYISLPSAVHPTYFIRYIGVLNNLDVYKNNIFNLNAELKKFNYIKLENTISLGNTNDVLKKCKLIWNSTIYSKKDIHVLLTKLFGSGLLDFISNELLKNKILMSLEETLILMFGDLESVASSKVKNITIKLITWLYDHKNLLKDFNYENNNKPKVLYYGDIKLHEALYLIFLYNIGVDIIYINTFTDNIFEKLDENFEFSSLYINETIKPYFDFPITESLVRQETVAFKASEEIDKIIHNDQDGVYKPWQFENYNITPLTLKTTFEELNILWKEPARFRSGFKVTGQTIYCPNLFVKISGSQPLLEDYYRYVAELTSATSSILINELPITKTEFNRQDTYRLSNVLNSNELIDINKLRSNNLYKYSYLSDTIQLNIIKNIEELFTLDVLTINMDINMKLRILNTILNLDKSLLELIQNFDYPNNVPKIIIYDSKESIFSIEDSIIMIFLYLNGFDICVLTPTGYNNFEMHIDSKFYDIFKLESKQFNLILPDLTKYKKKKSKGFWSNLFG